MCPRPDRTIASDAPGEPKLNSPLRPVVLGEEREVELKSVPSEDAHGIVPTHAFAVGQQCLKWRGGRPGVSTGTHPRQRLARCGQLVAQFVNSFSRASSSRRATGHPSRVPFWCCVIGSASSSRFFKYHRPAAANSSSPAPPPPCRAACRERAQRRCDRLAGKALDEEPLAGGIDLEKHVLARGRWPQGGRAVNEARGVQ